MSLLQLAKMVEPDAPMPILLDGKLEWLEQFGKPRVSMLDTGWCASIEMRIKVNGGKFEIRSEFGHPNATVAVDECIERVKAAMR